MATVHVKHAKQAEAKRGRRRENQMGPISFLHGTPIPWPPAFVPGDVGARLQPDNILEPGCEMEQSTVGKQPSEGIVIMTPCRQRGT